MTTIGTLIMDQIRSLLEQSIKMFSCRILGLVKEVLVVVTMVNVEWAP